LTGKGALANGSQIPTLVEPEPASPGKVGTCQAAKMFADGP
jgi:hypothetical protein